MLLPQPEGPTIATTSPEATVNDTLVEHVERAEAVADLVGDQVHLVS